MKVRASELEIGGFNADFSNFFCLILPLSFSSQIKRIDDQRDAKDSQEEDEQE